jgi:hypothetical protein
MHLGGHVPARRAPHPARVSHLDDQLVDLVLHDPHHPHRPEVRPDRHPVGGTRLSPRRPYRPTIATSDAHAVDSARPSSSPPIPTIRAVSAWQRWFDRSHELELAAALDDGGGTGKDRGGELVVCGPAVNIREVLDAAGLASLVDEVETTEVEMTHD